MAVWGRSSSRRRSPPAPVGRRLGDLLAILSVTILAALAVKTFVLDASYIPTRSMLDVLDPGDFVLVNKLVYGARTPPALSGRDGPLPDVRLPALRDPRRGDILLFWLPSGTGPGSFRTARQYVKRCVALPGDTLSIRDGSVRVDGRLVAHLESDTTTRLDLRIPRPGDTLVVDDRTPGILLGLLARDRALARSGARDGDDPGPDARNGIHVVVNEFYFLLGDRTSISIDSRHWGLIPRPWVIGTPVIVYWSVEPESARGGFLSRLQGVRWSRLGRLVR